MSEAEATKVLDLRDVSKVYSQGTAPVRALAGVSLSVRAGEMVAVMGPSGSGKSTLLTIAGSLEDPASGEVVVGGAMLADLPRAAKARLRRRVIGYVFQDFNLLPGLTAVENVWRCRSSSTASPSGGPARPGSRRLTRSAWPTAPAGSPTNCPAASGSGSRSPAPWSGTVSCCSPTSRRAPLTR